MSTFSLVVAGFIAVASLGLMAYLRFIWKLPMPWRYLAATWAVAGLALFLPWVALVAVVVLVLLGAGDRALHGS